jgi:hypothetical protein
LAGKLEHTRAIRCPKGITALGQGLDPQHICRLFVGWEVVWLLENREAVYGAAAGLDQGDLTGAGEFIL